MRGPLVIRSVTFVAITVAHLGQCFLAAADSEALLFRADQNAHGWTSIQTPDFNSAVPGVVYRKGQAREGIPLGGLGTGYVDFDVDGTLGRCTAFSSYVPPRDLGGWPPLGIAVDGQTVLLTTKDDLGDIKTAENIAYWGHYPVADAQFELPISLGVAVRAWSPFLPGDAEASNTPGAVFEVRIKNTDKSARKISLVFDFPGPSLWETGEEVNYKGWLPATEEPTTAEHEVTTVKGAFSGVVLASTIKRNFLWKGDRVVQYALGVAGNRELRHGGSLGKNVAAWEMIGSQLPPRGEQESGASVAVDLELQAGQEQSVRFILAWYAPRWLAQQFNGDPLNGDRHVNFDKYADRFSGAQEVAEYLGQNHESLLTRILSWQSVIYDDPSLPDWLKDCLVNVNHILAQNAFWTRPVPRGSNPWNWSGERGVFSVNESLVSCPQPSCTPCEWLGNMPILYFFPELAELNLRSYAYWQLANGKIPFNFGYGSVIDSPVSYDAEVVTNGAEFVQMLDRIWQRTGDNSLLEKYYPNAKLAMQFMMRETDTDGNGLPDCEAASHIFDCYHWHGNSSMVSSFWIGTLKVGERLARAAGDDQFAQQCQQWYRQGKQSLDEELWNSEASSYLNYSKPGTELRSDIVLVDQLIGQWIARYHGVDAPYSDERAAEVLSTISRLNAKKSPYGLINGVHPDGSDAQENHIYNGIHVGVSTHFTSALMLYDKDPLIRETGLEMSRRAWQMMVVKHGRAFNSPVFITVDKETGETEPLNEDYYHNTSIWILPAAIYGEDVKTTCAPGSLVDRIVDAAKP